MRDQLRLKLIIPLVIVATGGLAVAKFVLLADDSGEAAAAPDTVAATITSPVESDPAPATTEEETETTTGAEEPQEAAVTGLTKLEDALAKKKVVVVVVYLKDGNVDTLQVSEARAGADDVRAGFLSLNGRNDSDIGELAETYDIRTTPIVLVFRRGPELVARFSEYADRETVAQAAHTARQGAA
jgi:hypothetical protein